MSDENPYLELAKDIPDQNTTEDNSDNPYMELAANLDTMHDQNLKGSTFVAADKDPDQHAKVLTLAEKYGSRSDFIEENYDIVRKQNEKNLLDEQAFASGPKLKSFIANPDNMAVSKDDLDILNKIEGTVDNHSLANDAWKALQVGGLNLNSMLAKTPGYLANALLIPENIYHKYNNEPQRYFKIENALSKRYDDAAANLSAQIPDLNNSAFEQLGNADFKGAAKTAMLQFVSNAPVQMGLIASMMTGVGEAGLVAAGVTAAAAKGDELQKQGIEPLQGTAVAGVNGLIEASFESIGTMGLLKSWEQSAIKNFGKQGGKEFVLNFGKQLFHTTFGEGTEEAATSFAQDFVDYSTGVNPDAMKGSIERSFNAGLIGGLSGGLMTSPSGFGLSVAKSRQLYQIKQTQAFYEDLGKFATDSKLRVRAPEKFKELVARLTKDGPVEKTYIDQKGFNEYFQSKNINPTEAAIELGITEQYNDAVETGADIEVPTAIMAEKFAPNEHYQGLTDHIKFTPDALTKSQYDAAEAEFSNNIKQEYDAAMATKSEDEVKTFEDSAKEVATNIERQLVEQQLDKSKDAKDKALTISEFFKVMAARSGQMPMDLFNKYGLKINNMQNDLSVEGKTQLFQTNTDKPNPSISPLGFYSQVESEISKMDFNQIPAKDLANRIKNIQGLKKEELDYIGLEDYLNSKDGKVSKEEVLAFVKENGLQVDQVMLGGAKGESESGLNFSEAKFIPLEDYDRDRFYSAVDEEVDNDRSNFEPEGDETFNEDAAQKRAEEYVNSEEYYGAVYKITEENTGEELIGNGDYGWYSELTREHYDGNEEEAKIKFAQALIEGDHIPGASLKDVVSADQIKFKKAEGPKPSRETIKKKVKALVKTDFDRLFKISKDKYPYLYEDYKADKTAKEIREYEESQVEDEAKEEIKATYDDINNKKNKVTIQLNNEYPGGKLIGNNIKGWTYENEEYEDIKVTIEAKDLEAAKKELVQKLVEKDIISDAKKGDPNDINKSSGSSKWKKYTAIKSDNYRELLLTLPKTKGDAFTYTTHFDEKNFVAHARLSDVEIDGKKTLFIEEIQSDWHQQGRERGYQGDKGDIELLKKQRDQIESDLELIQKGRIEVKEQIREKVGDDNEAYAIQAEADERFKDLSDKEDILDNKRKEITDKIIEIENAVPDAPFKQTDAWASLVMKRLIRLATEQGYEKVAWTPAKVHQDRWGTDNVSWVKKDSEGKFEIIDENGKPYKEAGEIPDKSKAIAELEKYKDYIPERNKLALQVDKVVRDMGEFYTNQQDSAIRVAVREGKLPQSVVDRLAELNELHFSKRDTSKFTVKPISNHWLVGSAEQRGGNADGTNIEELARMRGQLLERSGEKVTTKQELQDVIASTLGREKTDRSLESLTERVWKQMESGDQQSGEVKPRAEGMAFFYDKMIPDVTKKLLKKLDPEAKIEVANVPELEDFGGKALAFDITDKIKEKATNEGFTLFQENKGSITFGDDRKFNINLFKGKDASTFFHESGHFFLEVMGDIAQAEGADDLSKKDYAATLKWLGVNSRSEITTEHHEKFARGFEAYLYKGEAPNEKLKGVFRKFANWLKLVYKNVAELNVEVSPEMKEVFDRMLAADEQVDKAYSEMEPIQLFADPKSVGMTDAEALEYLNAVEFAKQEAKETLTAQLMKDILRKAESAYKKKYNELYDSEMKKAESMNEFKTIKAIQAEYKLSKPVLERDYEVFKNYLPRGSTQQEGGMHPDMVAGLYGYENGQAMLQAIAPFRKGIEDYVTTNVADTMKSLYPELLTSPELSNEAIKAAHNDNYKKLKRMELDYLFKNDPKVVSTLGAKLIRRMPTDKMIRAVVEKTVGKTKVKDINPRLFKSAERKYALEASKAFKKGEYDLAIEAKRKEYLNSELYRATEKSKEEIEKTVDKFDKIFKSDEAVAKSRDLDLVSAARYIWSTYGLASDKDQEKTATYLDKLKQYQPDLYKRIEPLLVEYTKNKGSYEEMSYDSFIELSKNVQNIWDMSKTSNEIMIEGKAVLKETIVNELIDRSNTLSEGKEMPGYNKAITDGERRGINILGLLARYKKIEHWAYSFDGGALNGPATKYIFRPISEAQTKFELAKIDVTKKLEKIATDYLKNIDNKKSYSAPEIGYTFKNKQELLYAILHTGNESNYEKLLIGGRGNENPWGYLNADETLNDSQFKGMVDRMIREGSLTRDDFMFAQSIWDLNEQLKPDAQKAHKRIYGFSLTRLQPKNSLMILELSEVVTYRQLLMQT